MHVFEVSPFLRSGVAVCTVLVGLYEEPERPTNAVDYIKRYMGAPTNIDVEAIKAENDSLKKQVQELTAVNGELQKQVCGDESVLLLLSPKGCTGSMEMEDVRVHFNSSVMIHVSIKIILIRHLPKAWPHMLMGSCPSFCRSRSTLRRAELAAISTAFGLMLVTGKGGLHFGEKAMICSAVASTLPEHCSVATRDSRYAPLPWYTDLGPWSFSDRGGRRGCISVEEAECLWILCVVVVSWRDLGHACGAVL